MSVRADGPVRSVAWDGPAFRAGLRPGVRLAGVNAAAFTHEALLHAVRGSARHNVSLRTERDGELSKVTLAYAGPLRYPRLQHIVGRADTLAALLAPR